MRILVVDSAYPAFLDAFYAGRPELADASYEELTAALRSEFFGFCDSYATHLTRLGHEATAVSWNDPVAQERWMRERSSRARRSSWRSATRRLRSPQHILRSAARRVVRGAPEFLETVLVEQVRTLQPELILCLDIVTVRPRVLAELRASTGAVLVGQHAASPFQLASVADYDLFVSSVPPVVEAVRRSGARAEHLRLGFDPDVLDVVPAGAPTCDLSFVGSLFPDVHASRLEFLERLCERFPSMKVWTKSVDHLPPKSAIRDRYAGPAWGTEMYRVMRSSRLTLNRHDDLYAYANNCRLYEATGCGAALLTDAKNNLSELFEVGREVLAYEDLDHCVELVERHLRDEESRAAVARAGHERTLRDHTYDRRMEELLELVGRVAGRQASR